MPQVFAPLRPRCRFRAGLALAASLLGIVGVYAAVAPADSPAPASRPSPPIFLTADTEGEVLPCRSCPSDRGLGGLARRATLLRGLRPTPADALLLDAGNFLIGADSAASSGRVMAAAYTALGYDAVNLSYRDLRAGKASLAEVLKDLRLSVISCNLYDEGTDQPLANPFVVKTIAGRRWGIIGVTEAPAGMGVLPHLRQQLAGVKIIPPADALATHLPKLREQSDEIVLLYYGGAAGLRAISRQFGSGLRAIAVGGIEPERLPRPTQSTAIAASPHGKRVSIHQPGEADFRQIAVDPSLADDEGMVKLLATYSASPAVAGAVPRPVDRPLATQPAAPVDAVAAPATSQPAQAAVPAPVPPPPAVAGPTRVPARQPHKPAGLAGVGLTQPQVDAAVARGADFLWKYIRVQADGSKGQIGGWAGEYEGYHTVAALALVRAGLHRRDADFDRRLRDYLDRVRPEKIGTYACGVLCMLIEAYGDTTYEPKLRAAARYLFEGFGSRGWDYAPTVDDDAMADPRSQKPLQVWGGRQRDGDGARLEKWQRATTQRSDEHDHDNSLAQFAVLGLHSAARTGVEVPIDLWRQVEKLIRSRQAEAGGWGYSGATSAPYGSMTCAAAYVLTVARYHLGEKAPAEDEAIERGLGWLSANFDVEKNPSAGTANLYYYLYSLERLGRTLDSEFIGPHEWYPKGAAYLLGVQQQDGAWHNERAENRIDLSTSFALLFLTRGTPQLATATTAKQDGPGTLKTGLLQPPAPRLYLILDCSGSMMVEVNGTTKFDAARASIAALLAELPDATQVALRAYGHRRTALDAGASDDTELLLPMGPLDRQAIAERLKRLRPRGKTPMARSLQESLGDINGMEKNLEILLLTDGGEDSQPRQDPIAAAAAIGRVPGAVLHVVGFDIGRDDWGQQLRGMASAGKGKYWSAADSASLLSEMRAAVLRSPGPYQIRDAHDAVIGQGVFGDSKSLAAGRYAFVTTFGGKRFNEPFWVNAGETTAILFDAGKFDVTPPPGGAPSPAAMAATRPAEPAPLPPPNAAPPVRARFCTECGKPLLPAGKFCTNCGRKIAP